MPTRSSMARRRRQASLRAAATNQQRHADIFPRVEFGQQVMELVDKAQTLLRS